MQNGFTFIEVLVALCLFAVALVAIDATFFFTTYKTNENLQVALAIHQLHNGLEILEKTDAFANWQAINQLLLVDGVGELQGRFPDGWLSLCWGKRHCITTQDRFIKTVLPW